MKQRRALLSRAVWLGLVAIGLSVLSPGLAGVVPPAWAQEPPAIAFGPALQIPAGDHPFALADGDFNEDGITDLAVGTTRARSVGILLGRGDGTFLPLIPIGWGNSTTLAVADFNGDGHQDLVGSEFGPLGSNDVIDISFGNGDGTFGPKTVYDAGLHVSLLAVGDFNGDGLPDVVVGGRDGVSERLNTGSGLLGGTIVVSVGGFPYGGYLVAADFDGDGIDDLTAAAFPAPGDDCVGPTYLGYYRGLAAGSFEPRSLGVDAGCFPADLDVTDLDGDGRPDLVLLSSIGGLDIAVTEHRNLGGASFAPPPAYIAV